MRGASLLGVLNFDVQLTQTFFVIYTVHPAVQPPVQICRYAPASNSVHFLYFWTCST